MRIHKFMRIHTLLLLFPIFFFCPEVLAAVFDVLPTDKSKEYLGIVFGGSVGAVYLGGSANPTLSLMFERFNFVIVTFGITMLSYIGVISIINTAREGEAMGKKLSLWVPLRAVLGMLLMVPGPATGYSVVQMTVLWIVLNGIGAANQVWSVVVDQLAKGVRAAGTISVNIRPSDIIPDVNDIRQSLACMYAINNMPALFTPPNGTLVGRGKVQVFTEDVGITNRNPFTASTNLYVGIRGSNDDQKSLCGKYIITTSVINDPKLSTFSYNEAGINTKLKIKVNAVMAMFNTMDPAGKLFASPYTDNSTPKYQPPDAGYTMAAANAYITAITAIASGGGTQQQVTSSTTNADYHALKQFGWIHAGSYYYKMVKAEKQSSDPELNVNTALNIAQKNTIPQRLGEDGNYTADPNSINQNGWPTIGSSYSRALASVLGGKNAQQNMNQFQAAMQHAKMYDANSSTPSALPDLSMDPPDTGSGMMNDIVKSIAEKVRNPILEYLKSVASGSSQNVSGGGNINYQTWSGADDPLISLGKFGSNLMLAAETSVFVALILAFFISLATSFGSCVSPAAWANNFLFMQLIPAIYALLVMLWSLGATLGIYTPLVPYLVFTATSFGWLISVTEAIVGAPLIALSLVHPTGEELGQATKALAILANLFLRPMLMIFGFVLGASMLRAAIALVNFGFVQAVQTSTVATLFSIIPVMGMYVMLVVGLVNKSFSLIYMLPNQIMRWMGGAPEEGGGQPGELVGEAKKGFEQGQQFSQKGLETGQKATTEMAQKPVKDELDRKKMDDQAKANAKYMGGGGGGGGGGDQPPPGVGAGGDQRGGGHRGGGGRRGAVDEGETRQTGGLPKPPE